MHSKKQKQSSMIIFSKISDSPNYTSTTIRLRSNPNLSSKSDSISERKIDDHKPSLESSQLNPFILTVSNNKQIKRSQAKTLRGRGASLRIQIDKIYSMHSSGYNEYLKPMEIENDGSKVKSDDKSMKSKKILVEEVEVASASSPLITVYRFNPVTGKITVCKRKKKRVVDDQS